MRVRHSTWVVTPEELREVMYLTAPFIGFPKMLNAVATVNEVFKERGISLPLEKQGTVTEETRHETGKAIQDKLYPGGIASVMEGVPDDMGKNVEQFLTDYFFGEIYSRGALDLQTRELLGSYCVLTTLGKPKASSIRITTAASMRATRLKH